MAKSCVRISSNKQNKQILHDSPKSSLNQLLYNVDLIVYVCYYQLSKFFTYKNSQMYFFEANYTI